MRLIPPPQILAALALATVAAGFAADAASLPLPSMLAPVVERLGCA